VTSGSLLDPSSDAPATGERTHVVLRHRNLVVEQILSGANDEPVGYAQEQDEWVLLTAGAATLEVDARPLDLVAGDWAFLPAGVPHRVLRTVAGTGWLAVHLHP
jgi:mannose-6-phosphate isomerase-like protein (cupin superfamily)